MVVVPGPGDPRGARARLLGRPRRATIQPDQGRHEQYGFFMDRYTELYPATRDVTHQVTSHIAAAEVPGG